MSATGMSSSYGSDRRRKRRLACALYRFLGNDLTPLHGEYQTLENTRFLLENEPRYDDTERYWVVNRIVDSGKEKRLLELLKDYGENIFHIPFNRVCYDAGTSLRDALHRRIRTYLKLDKNAYRDWDLEVSDPAYLASLHRKVLYLVNVNVARNLALRHGRRIAKFVAPLDGGCFLAPSMWKVLSTWLESADVECLVLPLMRMEEGLDDLRVTVDTSNNHWWWHGEGGKHIAPYEPQIVARYDTSFMFNELLRYGRRTKSELLYRIGVDGADRNWARSDYFDEIEPDSCTLAAPGGIVRLKYRREAPHEARLQALIAAKEEYDVEARWRKLKRDGKVVSGRAMGDGSEPLTESDLFLVHPEIQKIRTRYRRLTTRQGVGRIRGLADLLERLDGSPIPFRRDSPFAEL